jgi:predicted ester cyclase
MKQAVLFCKEEPKTLIHLVPRWDNSYLNEQEFLLLFSKRSACFLGVIMETQEYNKRLVISHFEDFVNRKDLSAIDRNMTADFLDHDGPGGKPIDREGDRRMMAAMHQALPDLRVEVRDVLAEGDRVVVRNFWSGTAAATGSRMECHGFVLWRIADGKIVERWATVTPLHEMVAATLNW